MGRHGRKLEVLGGILIILLYQYFTSHTVMTTPQEQIMLFFVNLEVELSGTLVFNLFMTSTFYVVIVFISWSKYFYMWIFNYFYIEYECQV